MLTISDYYTHHIPVFCSYNPKYEQRTECQKNQRIHVSMFHDSRTFIFVCHRFYL
jgi:hypothetical protein